MDLSKLKDPFPALDIEWRVQNSGMKGNKPWAMVLAYVTNRAIMDRLDEVCEPQGWQNEFADGPKEGLLCGISIKVGDEWVRKWDGADNTQIEAVKGGLSGAMKRAGSQWGIGRYLYKLDAGWADFTDKGIYSTKIDNKYYKWNPPKLPTWALPKGEEPAKKPANVAEPEPEEPGQEQLATDAQLKKLNTMIREAGLENTNVKAMLKVVSKKDLTKERVKDIFERWPDFCEQYDKAYGGGE